MTDFMKEYIQSVRMCSYLIEPPASEVVGNLCDHIEHLQKRIEELEQERRWIPVSEQPKKTGYYIISWENYIHDSKLNSDYGFFKVGEGWNVSSIKYWQPLPPPPQEEE